jgi:hypothetical protein
MSENTQLDSWDGLLINYLKADDVLGDVGSEAIIVCYGVEKNDKNLDLKVEYNGKKYVFTLNVTNMLFLKEHKISSPIEVVGKKLTIRKSVATNPTTKKEGPALRISKIE